MKKMIWVFDILAVAFIFLSVCVGVSDENKKEQKMNNVSKKYGWWLRFVFIGICATIVAVINSLYIISIENTSFYSGLGCVGIFLGGLILCLCCCKIDTKYQTMIKTGRE